MHGELRRVASGLPRKRLALRAIVAVIVGGAATGPLRAEDADRAPCPRVPSSRSARMTCGRAIRSRRSPSRPTDGGSPRRRVRTPPRRSRSSTCGRAGRSGGSLRRSPMGSSSQCVAFSPDGTKLAWGEQEGDVALWDLAGDRLALPDEAT